MAWMAIESTYHTAVRNKTAEVKAAVAIGGALKSLLDDGVPAQLIFLDGLVDADNVLPDDTAGTDVEMTDFGVAHQTLRKTDGERGGFELGVAGGALVELVHDGGLGIGDGIAVLGALLGGNAPTVNDDYCERSKNMISQASST